MGFDEVTPETRHARDREQQLLQSNFKTSRVTNNDPDNWMNGGYKQSQNVNQINHFTFVFDLAIKTTAVCRASKHNCQNNVKVLNFVK